jgi:hypothetical protein
METQFCPCKHQQQIMPDDDDNDHNNNNWQGMNT